MTTGADKRALQAAALVAAVALGLHLVSRLLPHLFEPLSAQFTDSLFVLRTHLGMAPPYDATIVHVDIDDRSVDGRQGFYLDRRDLARLVRNQARAAVSAQLYDVVFPSPREAEADRELVEATAGAGNVTYGMAAGLGGPADAATRETPAPEVGEVLRRSLWHLRTEGDTSSIPVAHRLLVSFPTLASAARGNGFLDIEPDRDGVYRRAPLLVRYEDGFLPSAPLRVIGEHLGVGPGDMVLAPGRSLTLRGARPPGAAEARDIAIPIDRRGRMRVNWLGPWGSTLHYPYTVVYEASDDRFLMEDLRAELEGRITVVSWVSTGQGDTGPVPTDPQMPMSSLHANVMNTILSGHFLRQLTPLEMLVGVQLPLLALLLLAALRLSTLPFVTVALLLLLAYAGVATLAFLHLGWILDVPGPLLAVVGATVGLAAWQYHLEARARAVLRSTFDAYFPPSVVDKVMSHSDRLTSTAQKKELTILFSDIKSFTTHTAEMEAGRVRELLNEYFERMVEIVFRYQGTVDKFIGDGLMVFFGDPEPQADHAVRCVRAAREMQDAVREMGRAWAARGEMPLQIRIGINTGQVIVGNMGSERRLSYTVLGAPVNLAQRLEANAPVGGILVSRRTWELVQGAVPTRSLGSIQVKGIDTHIEVWEVPVDG